MTSGRLTKSEISKLVASLKRVTSQNPHLSFPQQFIMAQRVLDPDSRYVVDMVYRRQKWAKPLRDALVQARLWPDGEYDDEVQAVERKSPQKPVSKPAPVIQPPAPPALAPSVQQPTITKELMEQLLVRVRAEFAEKVHEEVKRQLSALLSTPDVVDQDEHHQAVIELVERTHQKVSVPRLFIVGLIPQQIVTLREKVKDLDVELRFWKDEAQSKLQDNIEWADEIYMVSKFNSHSTIHMITKRHREKLKYCNGAVSDLERQIRFKYSPQAVAA